MKNFQSCNHRAAPSLMFRLLAITHTTEDPLPNNPSAMEEGHGDGPSQNPIEGGIGDGPGQNLFKCDVCDKSYKYKKGLVAHSKVHQTQGDETEPQRAAGPERAVFSCLECHKTYRSERGFRKHMQQHNIQDTTAAGAVEPVVQGSHEQAEAVVLQKDIFDEIIANEEGGSEIELSGASVEVQHANKNPRKTKGAKPSHACSQCGKSFSTRNGLERHLIEHKIEACCGREITKEELLKCVEELLCNVLNDTHKEGGTAQKQIVDQVLTSKGSSDWNNFVHGLSNVLIECLSGTVPKAAIPSNRYHNYLMALNKSLNNNEVFSSLKTQLLKLLSSDEENIAGIILFRLCSDVFDGLCEKLFSSMTEVDSSVEEIPSEEIDLDGFECHVRKFIQMYYSKGLSSGSRLWISRCACVRLNFIDVQNIHEVLTADMISKNKSWDEKQIKLNHKVVSFFLSIEQIIVSLLREKKVAVTSEAIIDTLLSDKNSLKMEPWLLLTTDAFPELEAMAFMKELVSSFVKLSLKLEVDKLRDIEIRGRPGKYALRTDLKRN